MDRKKIIERVRDDVLKKYGSETVLASEELGDRLIGTVKFWVKSELEGLDGVLGREGFGIPVGKLIEVFGPEGHGKSTLVQYVLAKTQSQGGIAILLDTEGSFSQEWAKMIGVDLESLILIPVTLDGCLERYFDILESQVKAIRRVDDKIPVYAAWDTIFCTPTIEQIKSKSFQDTRRMLGLSRAMSDHLPVFKNVMMTHKLGMIFVNQIRDNVGVVFGDQFTSPGGHAVKHLADIRAIVKRTAKKEDGSIESAISNIKNKFQQPFAKCRFAISPKFGVGPCKKEDDE